MNDERLRRPWRVEYMRPDGWWWLRSYASRERAEQQVEWQEAKYPGHANGGYRVRHADTPANDLRPPW